MRKLDRKWQMLLYACSGFGVNLLNLMMGSYLCSALLIGGFKGNAILYQTYNGNNLVIAGVWATFVLIAKIIDGVIDIPMASFTDRLQTRFGRRRPSIVLGLVPMIAAYLLNTAGMRRKNILVVLLTLGMLVSTISVGLGLRILFGNNGFLDLLFGWKIEVLGFPGLILGSVMTSFPATFLILYDSLHYEDKGPYDAAAIMGISRLSTFFRLTVPYLRIALISAFCACFTLIFSDYGIPMEIAGKVKTLPMYLYDQFLSSFQYGRGSIAGFVLLIPAVVSFVFDLVFRDQSVSEKQKRVILPGKGFNRTAAAAIAVLCFLLFLPQLAFISLSFAKSFPNDLGFTLEHIANIFSNTHGVGLARYIGNSLQLAGMTALLGTCFAYLLGYLSVRKSGPCEYGIGGFLSPCFKSLTTS